MDAPVRLSLALIRRELLTGALASDPAADADAVAEALCALPIIRLSWLNIGPRLSGLDVLLGGRLKELHLQHNALSTIGDGLELLGGSLEFLSLSHNRLRSVEGLRDLSKLKILDLSDNFIDVLDAPELPAKSLRILELHGNPCMTRSLTADTADTADIGGVVGAEACRAACAARCPQLIELDQDPVERPGAEGADPGCLVTSDGIHAVSQHEYVREAIDALWSLSLAAEAAAAEEATAFGQPHAGGGGDSIGRETYRALHCRMYWALVGPGGVTDDADVDVTFSEDWLRDCGCADGKLLAVATGRSDAGAQLRMSHDAFCSAMLDTAAHFCGADGDGGERHDPVRVAAFLRQLLRDVATTDAVPVRWRPVAEVKGLFGGGGGGGGGATAGVDGEGEGGSFDEEERAMLELEVALRRKRDEAIARLEVTLEGDDLAEVRAMRAKLAEGRQARAAALAASKEEGMARIELAAGQLRGKLSEMGERRAARSKALKSTMADTEARIAALGEHNSSSLHKK